jgi:pectin methylesterase-like acyl-CoA thioesterase
MRRLALAATAFILLTGCSSTPASTPTTRAAVTGGAAGPPVNVAGSDKSGVSPAFVLAAGSYTVAWSTTASDAGCTFYLFLTTKADGPTVKDVPTTVLPEQKDYSGQADWTVPAGTYVMQEDRSGALDCTGSWDAILTPK